jgi:hypothetical protein
MKKKGNYQIPFDSEGNQLDYHDPSGWKASTLVDNFEFDDTLSLCSYGRGRSSVTFTMERNNGQTVSVFVSDFFDMANNKHFAAGQITGRFTFTKRGQNYGCKLLQAVETIAKGKA